MIDLKKMMHYMDSEDIYELLEEGLDDDSYNMGEIIGSLPFMDEDEIGRLALRLATEKEENNFIAFYPFMDEDDVGELTKVLSRRGVSVVNALPFMDEDDVDEILLEQVRAGNEVEPFLPFASDEGLHRLLMAYIQGELDVNMDKVYPFMDDEDIRTLFRYEIRKRRKEKEKTEE